MNIKHSSFSTSISLKGRINDHPFWLFVPQLKNSSIQKASIMLKSWIYDFDHCIIVSKNSYKRVFLRMIKRKVRILNLSNSYLRVCSRVRLNQYVSKNRICQGKVLKDLGICHLSWNNDHWGWLEVWKIIDKNVFEDDWLVILVRNKIGCLE